MSSTRITMLACFLPIPLSYIAAHLFSGAWLIAALGAIWAPALGWLLTGSSE